jgi:ribosomal subunit interface protein
VRVTTTERHCEVPKNVISRAESQTAALAKFESRATHADVIFSEEKRSRKVEIVVHVDGAPEVAGRGDGEDFRKALDRAVDRVRRQLREQRERRRDHHAPPLAEGLAEGLPEE